MLGATNAEEAFHQSGNAADGRLTNEGDGEDEPEPVQEPGDGDVRGGGEDEAGWNVEEEEEEEEEVEREVSDLVPGYVPIRKRKCTNVLALVAVLIALAVLVSIGTNRIVNEKTKKKREEVEEAAGGQKKRTIVSGPEFFAVALAPMAVTAASAASFFLMTAFRVRFLPVVHCMTAVGTTVASVYVASHIVVAHYLATTAATKKRAAAPAWSLGAVTSYGIVVSCCFAALFSLGSLAVALWSYGFDRARWNRVRDLVRLGATPVSDVPATVALPCVPLALFLLLFAFVLVALESVLVASGGFYRYQAVEPGVTGCSGLVVGQNCDPTLNVPPECEGDVACEMDVTGDDKLSVLLWFMMLVAFVWLTFFLRDVCQLVFAGVYSVWYFSRGDRPRGIVRNSLVRTVSRHLGTAALGSMTLTVFGFQKQVLAFLVDQVANTERLGRLTRGLKVTLEARTTHVYVMTAIHGTTYGKSAKTVAPLVEKYEDRYEAVGGFPSMYLVAQKLATMSLSSMAIVIVLLILKEGIGDTSILMILSVFFSLLGSSLATMLFFTTIDMALETVNVCFLMDLDQHSTSEEYVRADELIPLLEK